MCSIDDAEPVTPLSDTRPRARTPHRCTECSRIIEPGETYHRHSFVFEGKIGSSRCCTHCDVARSWLYNECRGWAFGGVRDDIAEHVSDGGYGPDLAALLANMRGQWRSGDALVDVPELPGGWGQVEPGRSDEQR